MQAQRTRGREARETASMESKIQLDREVRFIGYDRLEGESSVLAIYANGGAEDEAVEGDEIELLTAETPFYGESGGQIGDRGTITTARGDVIEVIDTHHPTPQLTAHRSRVKKGRIQVGDKVQLAVDPKHRQKTKLNHSATHILHSVLRRELGQHVRQAGSLVTPERLRFDFNHSGAIADEQLALIETHVNQHIREDAGVSIQEVSYDEAIRHGALAFFGDKYGDRVRVVKIGDISTELCGGTHVRASGEIGIFKLHSEGGVAAGVRRVEAFTGQGALDLIHSYEQRLKEIGQLVRGSATMPSIKSKNSWSAKKSLRRKSTSCAANLKRTRSPSCWREQSSVNGTKFLISQVDGVDAKQLRDLADQLKEKLGCRESSS